MVKKPQIPDSNTPNENNDTVRIDFDFDLNFYASPQAKQLLQWVGQALKWLFPFLVAFSTVRPVGVEQIQNPQPSAPPAIAAQQNPKTAR